MPTTTESELEGPAPKKKGRKNKKKKTGDSIEQIKSYSYVYYCSRNSMPEMETTAKAYKHTYVVSSLTT